MNHDNNNGAECLTMTDALYYCSAPILQANGLSLHKLSPYIQYVIIRWAELDSNRKTIAIRDTSYKHKKS